MGSRLEHRLLANVAKASKDYGMLEDGDRVVVALSGGKDSWVLLHLLRLIQRRVPFSFSLVAVNLDQRQPGFDGEPMRRWLEDNGYEHRMLAQDTYSIVLDKVPEGKTYCSMCSRLRRGILYNAAVELGATKLALGHHRDDIIETLMLNLLYSGQLKAMAPRYTSDDGRNVLIRPLAYCDEAEIAQYAGEVGFPIIPCNLCGSQDGLKRARVKQLINELAADNPKVRGNMFAALCNVRPSHLLDPSILRQD